MTKLVFPSQIQVTIKSITKTHQILKKFFLFFFPKLS